MLSPKPVMPGACSKRSKSLIPEDSIARGKQVRNRGWGKHVCTYRNDPSGKCSLYHDVNVWFWASMFYASMTSTVFEMWARQPSMSQENAPWLAWFWEEDLSRYVRHLQNHDFAVWYSRCIEFYEPIVGSNRTTAVRRNYLSIEGPKSPTVSARSRHLIMPLSESRRMQPSRNDCFGWVRLDDAGTCG